MGLLSQIKKINVSDMSIIIPTTQEVKVKTPKVSKIKKSKKTEPIIEIVNEFPEIEESNSLVIDEKDDSKRIKDLPKDKFTKIKAQIPKDKSVKMIKAGLKSKPTLTEILTGINPHKFSLNDYLANTQTQTQAERVNVLIAESNPFGQFISNRQNMTKAQKDEIKSKISELYKVKSALSIRKSEILAKGETVIKDGKIDYNGILPSDEKEEIDNDLTGLSLRISDVYAQIKAMRYRLKGVRNGKLTLKQVKSNETRKKNKEIKAKAKALEILNQGKNNLSGGGNVMGLSAEQLNNQKRGIKQKARSLGGSFYAISMIDGKICSHVGGNNGSKFLKKALNFVGVELPDSQTQRKEYNEKTAEYENTIKQFGMFKSYSTGLKVYIVYSADIDSVEIPKFAKSF